MRLASKKISRGVGSSCPFMVEVRSRCMTGETCAKGLGVPNLDTVGVSTVCSLSRSEAGTVSRVMRLPTKCWNRSNGFQANSDLSGDPFRCFDQRKMTKPVHD